MSVHCGACEGWKSVSGSLGPELQMVVSFYVDARNQTQVLCGSLGVSVEEHQAIQFLACSLLWRNSSMSVSITMVGDADGPQGAVRSSSALEPFLSGP